MFDAIRALLSNTILAFEACDIVPDVTSFSDDDEALM